MILSKSPANLLVSILVFMSLLTMIGSVSAEDTTVPPCEKAEMRGMYITHMRQMSGDNPKWAEANFDDKSWPLVDIRNFQHTPGIHWFRQNFTVWPEYIAGAEPAAFYIEGGASMEIFFNGVFVGRNGYPGNTSEDEKRGKIDAQLFVPVNLFKSGNNVLAVRYSSTLPWNTNYMLGIGLRFGPYLDTRYNRFQDYLPSLLLIGAVGATALFFGVSFLLRREEKTSLWLSLMLLCVVSQFSAELYRGIYSYIYVWHSVRLAAVGLLAIGSGIFLNLFIHARFNSRLFPLWFSTGLMPIVLISSGFKVGTDITTYYASLAYVVLAAFETGNAYRLKRNGAAPLLTGLALFSLAFHVPINEFLDGTYYYAMSALSVALFVLRAATFETTRQKAQDAESLSSRLKLELLKKHLQPHFVMNTLMALSEWIVQHPKTGLKMIQALAAEFRILYEVTDNDTISLEREIELCQAYLELMSYRKNQLFKLKLDVTDKNAAVPPAIFHTLIENALSHNIYQDQETEFSLSQQITNDSCRYVFLAPIGDPVIVDQKMPAGSSGIGLSYVKARLNETWGDRASFEDGRSSDGLWRTTVQIETGTP